MPASELKQLPVSELKKKELPSSESKTKTHRFKIVGANGRVELPYYQLGNSNYLHLFQLPSHSHKIMSTYISPASIDSV